MTSLRYADLAVNDDAIMASGPRLVFGRAHPGRVSPRQERMGAVAQDSPALRSRQEIRDRAVLGAVPAVHLGARNHDAAANADDRNRRGDTSTRSRT